jgi:hypothetical protein
MEEEGGYCYRSFAYTRTLDLSDSAKACIVLKAVSYLQDFLTTTILLSPSSLAIPSCTYGMFR